METEDLAFHDCCKGEIIEKLSKLFPNIGISILSQAFIIKPISIALLDDNEFSTLE